MRGLPRIYVSCNSGARVGLVEELKPLFKVLKGEEYALAWLGLADNLGEKTSPSDSEHFPHLKSLKVAGLDSVHLIFRHTQEFVLILEGRVGPHQKW